LRFAQVSAHQLELWLGLAWLGFGLAWLGLAWLGLVLAWLGLAWLGLAWLGLAWLGFSHSSETQMMESTRRPHRLRILTTWRRITTQKRQILILVAVKV